jgi:very-short-patch-repair endonuclease
MPTFSPLYVKALAKELRKRQTPAESELWQVLRGRQVCGCKFYRQFPIERYIADFYCPATKLVIEIDGPIHEYKSRVEYDKIRQEDLASRGMRVIRFTNDQVKNDLTAVLNEIRQALSK